MERIETNHVAECYASITTRPDMPTTCFLVKGKMFTQEIFRPIGGRSDILLSYVIAPDLLYELQTLLFADAVENRVTLQQTIAGIEPWDRYVQHEIEELGWSWANNVAPFFATYAEAAGALGHYREPFLLKGFEAQGTNYIKMETGRWRNGDWRVIPPAEILPITMCMVCQEDISQSPTIDLITLHECCHIFHKTCLYKWIWSANHHAPDCPVCRGRIY